MNKYMKLAYKEATKAYAIKEVPVGAIIIKDNKVISKAYNLRETKNLSIAHAEILAINKACKKLNSWRLDDCTMYVTLEPCMMCAGAISQSRIKTVYIGALDAKNGAVKSIMDINNVNTTHKVEYIFEKEDDCEKILKDFFKELRINKQKPFTK